MKKLASFKPLLLAGCIVGMGVWIGAVEADETAPAGNPAVRTTHYVTDTLEVPVRSGAGRDYRIINLLRSGTPVEVLDINEKGWAHIRYEWKGKLRTAWIPSSLLANEPPAAVKLEAAQKRLEAQTVRIQRMEEELNNVRREYDRLKSQLAEGQKRLLTLTRENEHLRQLAGKDLDLDRENQKLRQQIKKLEEENRILNDQVNNSDDVVKRRWFLTGAAVLAAGFLLGFLLRVSTGGRRRSWGSL